MVWPWKQNASGKTPQTSFNCWSKWEKTSWTTCRTRWTNYIEDLGWNGLGLHPSEMINMMEDHKVRLLNLELLPPQPSRKSGWWRKKKKSLKIVLSSWPFLSLALKAVVFEKSVFGPRYVSSLVSNVVCSISPLIFNECSSTGTSEYIHVFFYSNYETVFKPFFIYIFLK